MSKIRAVFLGTPEFAVVSLKEMLRDPHFEIVGVVTQPDRPAGRKLRLNPSPVKTLALAHGLRVISPEKINQDMILQEVQHWGAEVAVVVAYGQILPQKFLDLFPFGAVNVHGSLLPRWRGAAPIQRALEAGDAESGVALQKIVRQLDAGDVFGFRRIAVPLEMTAMELHDQLAVLGANLLQVELMDYVRGNLTPIPQDSSLVTVAPKISKAECLLDWSKSSTVLHNKIRAFQLGPGAFTLCHGKILKIHRSRVLSKTGSGAVPGTVKSIGSDEISLQCGEGVLGISELQLEGKQRMLAAEFGNGHVTKVNDIWGN